MRASDRTWHLWLSGLLRPRYELCDEQGYVFAAIPRRVLDGERAAIEEWEGTPADVGLDDDTGEVVVRRQGSEEVLVRLEREHARIGPDVFAFSASRNRTCTAQITDGARILFSAGPVRARSHRPFLRLDLARDLPDQDLVAVAVCYLIARDDASSGASMASAASA